MEKKKKLCPIEASNKKVSPSQDENPEETHIDRHPLLIELVLKELFKYNLQQSEVARNRLVCRAWHKMAKVHWTKFQKFILFQTDKDMEEFGESDDLYLTLRQLRELCERRPESNQNETLCTKFQLQDWKFTTDLNTVFLDEDDNVKDLVDERWFLNTPTSILVTEITLNECTFLDRLIVLEKEFLQKFPNLEKLTLWDIKLDKHLQQQIANQNELSSVDEQIQILTHKISHSRMKLNRLEDSDNSAIDDDDNKVKRRRRGQLFIIKSMEVVLAAAEARQAELFAVHNQDGLRLERVSGLSHRYRHPNLKALTVKTWNQGCSRTPTWSQFLKYLPSLEFLCLRGPDLDSGQNWETYLRKFAKLDLHYKFSDLQHLDTMDFASYPISPGGLCSHFGDLSSLKTLKYDVGHDQKCFLEKVCEFIYNNTKLEELHLYQAPLAMPIQNFLVNGELRSLRELWLWGVFSPTMEFLKAMPYLEVLVWTTSAYDEKYNGKRLFHVWTQGEKIYSFQNHDFLGETYKTHPILPRMTRLEIDWEPKSTPRWKKLRHIMPLLTSLKVLVTSHEMIYQISELWKGLEYLELAHGSIVNGKEFIEALTEFENLKKFVWKGCLCTQQQLRQENIAELLEYENVLKLQLPLIMELPWHSHNTMEGNAESEKVTLNSETGQEMCLRGKYEMALLTENPLVYTEISIVRFLILWILHEKSL